MKDGDLFQGVLPFVRVAELLSFRKAAEALGVTTAAVSKAVRELEERLGVKLFARTTRTVSLTPEGEQFLARCRDAIGSMTAARALMSEARRQPKGEVHLSLSFILGRLIVPELGKMAARHPALSFRISMSDRLARLAEEKVDVAIRIGDLASSNLVSRLLFRSRWVTVASPAYVARHGAPAVPADLARHNALRFVAPNGRPRDFAVLDVATKRPATVAVTGNLMIDHGDHLLLAAESGLGVCQVLDFMVTDALASGRLVELLPAYAADGPPIHAVMLAERSRTPNVRAVVSFLTTVLRPTARAPAAPG